jgi:hypothetical protein
MNEPAMNIAMGKMQWLDETIGDNFEKDRVVRSKLKELKQYNKLLTKTKIKRLVDKYKLNLVYLQSKLLADKNIIEQGGHPELGFENQYETRLDDDAYNAIRNGRRRRLKRINNGR